MRFFITFFILVFSFSYNAKSQLVGADVFLKGDYVEVGIATNGSFGTGGNAPSGYHPRPDMSLTAGPLGFVADPLKDGWSVSSPGYPDYFGDYFYPGTPQEGWDVEVNGSRGRAWRGSGAASFTGGITGSNTGYTSTPSLATGVWEGSMGNLSIKQTVTQKIDKVYFVCRVELKNTGATTLSNIYYNRSLDPEPDATVSGNYSSDKRIIYQPTLLSKNCLVVATGQDFDSAYVGLGSKDCRAKCYISNTYTPDAGLSNVYTGTGGANPYIYTVNGFSSANTSMGIVFNIGNLAPGETTELAYAYILKQADLDSALSETAPSFESDSVSYSAYTTFRVCPGNIVPLKIKGGSAYKWIWTPGTDLDADSLISSGSLPPLGGAFGDSVSVTVNGPRTYLAKGVSICDTLNLVFYVDTISFSVPPFVTTPVKYCQGATPVALVASGAASAKVLWSKTIGGPETTVAPTPTTSTVGTTRYFVRQQSTAGCYSQYAFIDVIIIAKPEPPGVRDTVYCFGAPAVAVSAIGSNIQWFDALTGGSKYISTPTPSTTGTTITYYPSQTVDGCVSDRAALKVDIAKIQALFDRSKDSLCGTELITFTNNSTYTLGGVTTPFYSFWSFGDKDTSSAASPSHSYANLGIYGAKLKVFDNYKCADSIVKPVYVAPKATISFVQSDSIICEGEAIDFAGKATKGYYQSVWDFGDGDAKIFNEMNVRQAFKDGGTFTVTLKASYTICGDIEVSKPVVVTGVPLVDIGKDTTICPGNPVLILKNYNTVSSGKLSYKWNTGDTVSEIRVRKEGAYWLTVNDNNCTASDSLEVTKGCYIDIPNAFMPGDSDPLNAYFLPRSLLSKSAVSFDMQIYDRWGMKIFETQNVDGKGWDGKYNGQDQPLGVYMYLIKVGFSNGLIENYSGNVTLIR